MTDDSHEAAVIAAAKVRFMRAHSHGGRHVTTADVEVMWRDYQGPAYIELLNETREQIDAYEALAAREGQPGSIEQETRPCFVASNGDLLMLTDEQAENVARILAAREETERPLFDTPKLEEQPSGQVISAVRGKDAERAGARHIDAKDRYAKAAEYIDASIEAGGSRPSPGDRERAIEKVLKATEPYLVRDTERGHG